MLKIFQWYSKIFDLIKSLFKKNWLGWGIGLLFAAFILSLTLFFSVEKFINFLSAEGNPLIMIIIKLFLSSIVILIIFLVCLVLITLLGAIPPYIIYMLIKPWLFIHKYEALLKILMDKEDIEDPDADREIKPKRFKTSKNFNKILEEVFGDS